MASQQTSENAMIIQYEWVFANVEKVPKTFASKMICFRGLKVFRLGLKNLVSTSPFLFFVAIDLNKIGLNVEQVTWGVQGKANAGPSTMSEMTKEEIDDATFEGRSNLRLFKSVLDKQVIGTCTFLFRIYITGSVPGYSYRLCDRLAKDQLRAAAKSKNGADVEIVVKGKTISAHKAILAARSPVFAAEFTKEQPAGDASKNQSGSNSNKRKRRNDGLQQIRIDGVKPSTVEEFLDFIYTGESVSSLANEELLKLAVKYKLKTLIRLCRAALMAIDATQMAKLMNGIHDNTEAQYSSTIKLENDTEILVDGTTVTFRCPLTFKGSENEESKCLTRYQNENIFPAYFTGAKVIDPADNKLFTIRQPVIHFSCSEHRRLGMKILDVYYRHFLMDMRLYIWSKMEPKHLEKNAEILLHFAAQLDFDFPYSDPNQILFDVKIVSTIDNYYYEMMDDDWMKHFWKAATDEKFTDVEIFIGTVKVMEAHRIILSARSPVLNVSLSKTRSTARKPVVTLDREFHVAVVENFLNYLYTGSLETFTCKSINYGKLLKLAITYEVETLKNICQLANSVTDVEQFTGCLLKL